jgi:putative transposase
VLSAHQLADIEIREAVVQAHALGRETYGTPRIKIELQSRGFGVSRRRIARLRDEAELYVKVPRSFVHTTDSNHHHPITPNLLNRKFVADSPNSIWVSDITYLTSGGKFVYLCTIIDCFSGAVVARQMSSSVDTKLVVDCFAMAIRNRQPAPGCIFHSDRGSQYASHAFREALAESGFIQSMSRKGNCWDNAVAESFFARIKLELGGNFENDYEAGVAVYEYIDVFYNFTRIHTRHACAPMRFELQQRLSA